MTRTDEPGISSVVVESVMRALAELGGRELSSDDSTIVAGTAADAMLDAAAAELSDMAIGISTAKRIPIGSLGDLDYALVTSTTLRDGLDLLVRYYSVVTQRVQLSLVETDTQARLVFERQANAEKHSRHWAEFASAMIAGRIRQTVGRDVTFQEVWFAHPAPSVPTCHDEYFGTTVRFDADVEVLAFDRALLASPLRTAAAALAEVLEGRLRQYAVETGAKPDAFVDRVRHAVVQLLDEGKASLEETASRVRTSTRTLQRELQQHGTSHQQIVDEVRRERAQQMLERGTPIVEVSNRLGFAEPSAFFRAFRRWTGTSPGTLKKKLEQE